MNPPEVLPIPQETLNAFSEHLRDAKHDISNAFAVLMALAELAERNPANYERLAKVVLERCPRIIDDLNNLQERFRCLCLSQTYVRQE